MPTGRESHTETSEHYRAMMDIYGAAGALYREAQAFSRIFPTDDTTHEERRFLRDLLATGPRAVAEMAREVHVSRQCIAALVARLADRGYVKRSDDSRVRLTPRGVALAEQSLARGERLCEFIATRLNAPEDVAATQRTLWRMVALVEEYISQTADPTDSSQQS